MQLVAEYWPILAVTLHAVIGLGVSSDIVLRKTDTRAALGWIGVVWLTPLLGDIALFRVRRESHSSKGSGPAVAFA